MKSHIIATKYTTCKFIPFFPIKKTGKMVNCLKNESKTELNSTRSTASNIFLSYRFCQPLIQFLLLMNSFKFSPFSLKWQTLNLILYIHIHLRTITLTSDYFYVWVLVMVLSKPFRPKHFTFHLLKRTFIFKFVTNTFPPFKSYYSLV